MNSKKKIIVTGGAGFIGSRLILKLLSSTNYTVANIDKLTYAGANHEHSCMESRARYRFYRADIADKESVSAIINEFEPDAIINLAAESHVDRSINGPEIFMRTNIMGTFTMLEAARGYWNKLKGKDKDSFVFYQISTDEVFGDLKSDEPAMIEEGRYNPSSPYSASKASADHLVNAWHRTYGLPVKLSYCTNNYGPFQYPEKFIPLMVNNALKGKELPVYGDGSQIRDWLYVDDHVDAIVAILLNGRIGESYNIAGNNELTNLETVTNLCTLLDQLQPSDEPYAKLIQFVTDRPGHDFRYALDDRKLRREIGWKPQYSFQEGLKLTINWYLHNQDWINKVLDKTYEI